VPVAVPVVTYSNAVTDKAIILAENKKKSGIYMFTNLKNGKRYIGSSLNLRNRAFSSLPSCPVKVYENAQLLKKRILRENKEAGIYM
jgi:hypothetical protein